MDGKGEVKHKRIYPVTAQDYKLLEEIGHGASATVYRAICIPFNEVVAIKNLDLEKCRSNLDEIRREAQTMCLIRHANVLRAHCSFMVDHSLWVIMPCMTGGSCLNVMKSAHPDGFEERVIATLLKETLKALDYLHKNGHIHRDVKAGNILVDAQGGVKLGDFGVSACMFDTGDRQRSRTTFVGTPCWMAPEVMDQLQGYDFKADIWSFGITALELAQGHAPFSKYPPMTVLLMILKNAPPELDYGKDRRFSKSYREMIAMCLVKDPAKRPSAEKLLKHSFFKNVRSNDYIAKHVMAGLPPLEERVKSLKLKDAALLAQKKMPYEAQEEKSQNEYIRGVSSWNFNVEDLKAEAALLHDDDSSRTMSTIDEHSPELQKGDTDRVHNGIAVHSSSTMNRIDEHTPELQKGAIDSVHNGIAVHDAAVRPENDHPELIEPTRALHQESLHRGKSQGSLVVLSVPQLKEGDLSGDGAGISKQLKKNDKHLAKRDDRESHELENEEKELKDPDHEDTDSDRVKDHRQNLQVHNMVDNVCRTNIFYRDKTLAASTGALAEGRGLSDAQPVNGMPMVTRSSSLKDVRVEKVKGLFVQRKGRFSITSEDTGFLEPLSQSSGSPQLSPTLMVHGQSSPSQHNAVHQDMPIHIVSSIGSVDGSNVLRLNHVMSKNLSRSKSSRNIDLESTSPRFRHFTITELQDRLAEQQHKIAKLVNELQMERRENFQLEHQLSAMLMAEEERIHRERFTKESG